MATRIKLRRDTATRWQNINPVLSLGEPGVETDTGKMKIGDGNKTWNLLDYFAGDAGGAADRLVNGANEVVLGADGVLTLPAGGDIVDSTGASVLGGGSGTLDSVTDSGSTTTNSITVGSVTLTNGAVIKDTAGNAVAFGEGAGLTSQIGRAHV